MSKVIAIANQKGGVGKTTTCINLGDGLCREGKRVLIIDTDPQGNATQSLGYNGEELNQNISSILNMLIERKVIPEGYGILKYKENLHIVPSNIELAYTEMKIQSALIGREQMLEKFLNCVRTEYDYIIIDCKPSLDILTINALCAADSVLIPVQAQYFSVRGLEQLMYTINQVITGNLNAKLKIEGILYTLVNDRTANFKNVASTIQNTYGNYIRIFNNYIPRAVSVEEAPAAAQSIFDYDPKGTVAYAYGKFIQEYLKGEK